MSLDRTARKQIEEEIAQTLALGDQEAASVDEAAAQEPEAQHDDSGTDAESSPEQASAPKSPGVLKSKLSQIYQLDDDTDEEELAEALIERLHKLEQAQKDAERRIAEAQARVAEAQQVQQAPVAQEPPQETKKRERKLKPIVKPDDELEALVEFDPDIKRYVGKEKFGQLGQEAAKQFNDYAMARAQRAEQWISEDPAELILSEVRDEIEKIAEEKAQAYLRRIQEEQQNTQYVSQRQQSEAEFVGFMETVKPHLYHLDAKGNIKTNPITGEPATKEAGSLFIQEYRDLLELSPNAPPALLAKKAYKVVEKMIATAPKDKKSEVAEKKKRFIDKRKHESGVTGNANVATTQDKFTGGAKVSLLAALLEDPANEDNPDLAQLR